MTRTDQILTHVTQWTSRHRYVWALFIFAAAFLPRLFSPITRPLQWEERSFLFREALLAHDWVNTYQQYHPGVTLMWLVSIGIQFFAMRYGPITQDMWFMRTPTPPGLMETGIVYAVAPLALVISLCILIIYWLLTQLVDRRLAVVAALMLAWDPYFLTYSRVVHVDGLLASFMLVSGLCVVVYARSGQRRYLLGSGTAAGLAFLTKSPSIFLIAYTGLILLVWQGYTLWRSNQWRSWRSVRRMVGRISLDLLIWGIVAATLFVALWPAMWVNAAEILPVMWSNLIRHAANPHRNPIYFLGESKVGDPGPLYYLSVIGWNTTLISLPAALLGMGVALWRGWRRTSTALTRVALAVFAFAFFFYAQMSIGEFKQLAYILPVFPALDVLAGVGLVALAEVIGQRIQGVKVEGGTAVLTLLLATQAILVLRHYPYYGNHYNALLGGTRTAMKIFPVQDQGEGLDIAAEYLNSLPHNQAASVAVFGRNNRTFRRIFHGQTTDYILPQTDFRVYDLHSMQRDLYDLQETWAEMRDIDMAQEPLFTVEFDGIPYVWVYGEIPTAPLSDGVTFTPDVRFGEHVTLQKTMVSSTTVTPGDTLTIVHYWQSDGEAISNDKVFNHLLANDGTPIAQRDGFPLDGVRPLSTWTADELMEDVYRIEIPTNAAPGVYQLGVGLYDPDTFARMTAVTADGQRFANDTAIIGTITINPP
ncbi:MAG: glycosyltransferase family 39 protein [Anaerolineales bacterium]|nr:glycosyltransferase family 39 protein [Anaerolineales bacterium]MCB8990967.1 glycosyltransferase family 39 protein [Ardenticatenaceae bacterium]